MQSVFSPDGLITKAQMVLLGSFLIQVGSVSFSQRLTMAVDRNKLEELLKQLSGEFQKNGVPSAESPHYRTHRKSSDNGAPPVHSFFGIWDSGNPRSADNDRIDADIVGECANSPEADS